MLRLDRADEMMVILLDHTNRDVVAAVAGVLMNLAADETFAASLRQLGLVPKLCDALDNLELQVRCAIRRHGRPPCCLLSGLPANGCEWLTAAASAVRFACSGGAVALVVRCSWPICHWRPVSARVSSTARSGRHRS